MPDTSSPLRKVKQAFLLIGHLDTVFEADDDFQAFTREGTSPPAPVLHMKDGNAVIVYALKALQHIGALDGIPITVAYTGDEENRGGLCRLAVGTLSRREMGRYRAWI